MTQTMPDKLRLIADAIEQGKTVQYKDPGCYGWTDYSIKPNNSHIHIRADMRHRIKPDKPLVGKLLIYEPAGTTLQETYPTRQSVELTPEVKQALKDAGIEW